MGYGMGWDTHHKKKKCIDFNDQMAPGSLAPPHNPQPRRQLQLTFWMYTCTYPNREIKFVFYAMGWPAVPKDCYNLSLTFFNKFSIPIPHYSPPPQGKILEAGGVWVIALELPGVNANPNLFDRIYRKRPL